MMYLDMLKGVLGKVSGCPEDEAVDAMRNTCAEFCEETRCWTIWEIVTVPAGGAYGAIDMERKVIDIVEAKIGDKPVDVYALNAPELQDLGPSELAITLETPDVLALQPAPTAAVQLALFRAFAPGPESTEIPDAIWLHHAEALRGGCLARLMSAPAQSWANPNLSIYNRTLFESAMKKAAAAYGINRKQVGRRLRVKPA